MLPKLAKLSSILGPKYAETWATAAELPVELEVRLPRCSWSAPRGKLRPGTIHSAPSVPRAARLRAQGGIAWAQLRHGAFCASLHTGVAVCI